MYFHMIKKIPLIFAFFLSFNKFYDEISPYDNSNRVIIFGPIKFLFCGERQTYCMIHQLLNFCKHASFRSFVYLRWFNISGVVVGIFLTHGIFWYTYRIASVCSLRVKIDLFRGFTSPCFKPIWTASFTASFQVSVQPVMLLSFNP